MIHAKNYFWIVLIIIVSLALRLYQIGKSTWAQPSFDEARDMLVADHIINNQEYVSRGPYAAGGMNALKNSPVYYYFVSVIWFFTQEPTLFMYAWSIIMTLPVLIGYSIGKKLDDKLLGLIIASLVGFNYQMVFSSRELFQPNLLLFLTICFIWASISYLKSKKNKFRYLILSILFLLLPLHFHYAVFIILPIGTLWIAYFWLDLNKNNKNNDLKQLMAPFFEFLGLVLTWIFSSFQSVPFDQVYFFTSNFKQEIKFTFFEQLTNTYSVLSQMFWGNKHSIILATIFFIAAIFTGFKSNKNTLPYRKSILFLISMSCSIIFFGLYNHSVQQIYVLPIFPFIIVITAIVLRLILKQHRIIGWILISICLFTIFNRSKTDIFNFLPEVSRKAQQMEIAKSIYEHYQSSEINSKKISQPKLLIVSYNTRKDMPFNGWETSGIWYYLEKYFDQTLVENTNYGVNHTPIEKFPSYIYMVCDYKDNPDLIQSECLDSFTSSYTLIDNKVEKIGESMNFSAWSARTDSKTQTKNLVNYELMND